jgi:hypothetical protein
MVVWLEDVELALSLSLSSVLRGGHEKAMVLLGYIYIRYGDSVTRAIVVPRPKDGTTVSSLALNI